MPNSAQRRIAAIHGVLTEAAQPVIVRTRLDHEARAVVAGLSPKDLHGMDKDFLIGLLTGFALHMIDIASALATYEREK